MAALKPAELLELPDRHSCGLTHAATAARMRTHQLQLYDV
jgi:hypothetical protein